MLTQITDYINKQSDNVVLRHPNSMAGTLWRRCIDEDAAPDELAYGGIGVLNEIEDEEQQFFTELCGVRVLQLSTDEEVGRIYSDGIESRNLTSAFWLVVSDNKQWEPALNDLIKIELEGLIAMVFEVIDIHSDVHLGRGTTRYEVQYRDELTWYVGADED